ncbi:hypothetical protein HKX48_006421 [Thoreauomyces humboldtii]|nr:hypothetical protein HKX48_006421 [Thoreauomyces humboldtii]
MFHRYRAPLRILARLRDLVRPPHQSSLSDGAPAAARAFRPESPSSAATSISASTPIIPSNSTAYFQVAQIPATVPLSSSLGSDGGEWIHRPPSPPGSNNGRRSHTGRRPHGIFEDKWLFAGAAAAGTSQIGARHGSGTSQQAARVRTYEQQRRYMSMPAVATPPHSADWFKKNQTQSIFELFEKAVPTPKRTFQFSHAASAMPKKPKKRGVVEEVEDLLSVQVGEDAYFVRPDSMGVADGVGGWSQYKGADPALYSRKLMHYASAELEKLDDMLESDYSLDDYNNVDPRAIMQRSYDQTNTDVAALKILGSTTAIIAVLRDDELRIANLGDCGVLIVRNDEPIFRSEEQQHSFNFPYQLGTGSRDSPTDAQTFCVKIEEGDIVILGSDGMFDNVFDEDIVDLIRTVVRSSGSRGRSVDPKKISDALLRRAREVAEDSRYASSPFQSRAIQEGMYYQGGKMDDVTVLAGIIRLSEDSPDRR